MVSGLLSEHFPDRYNRLPLGEAWRRIWLHDEFIGDPDSREEIVGPTLAVPAE